ncbi:VUT family protein [Pusillimonas sp. ANT_WB101]|nr:VUT family protein [Pusillimonas sp. ANT_WB101]
MFRLCWLAAYVGSVLLANIFLDHFLPLPGFGLLSLGSVFFAAVFTLRDRLHGYGLSTVLLGIGLAVAVNTASGIVLGLNPRLLMASFASIMLSELADTAIFQRLRTHGWHTRVLASNAVSVPLDSLAFTLLAFAGAMTTFAMAQIVFADVLGKYVIAAAIAWLPFLSMRERASASVAAAGGPVPAVKTACGTY